MAVLMWLGLTTSTDILDAVVGTVTDGLRPPMRLRRPISINAMAPPTSAVRLRPRLIFPLVGAGRLCRPVIPTQGLDPHLSGNSGAP